MTNHPNRSRKADRPGSTPTPAQIRASRESLQLTQADAAEIVHSGVRSWQQWEAEVGTADHRRMHPAFWELFRIKTGVQEG